MIVELIGGPRDGEIVDIKEHWRELRFCKLEYAGQSLYDSTQPPIVHTGLYRSRIMAPGYVPTDLHWHGWIS